MLHGDFGPSFKYQDFTVSELLGDRLPGQPRGRRPRHRRSRSLLGVALGTLAALRQNTGLDHAVMATAMTGIAIPNFVMAPLLTLLFGV